MMRLPAAPLVRNFVILAALSATVPACELLNRSTLPGVPSVLEPHVELADAVLVAAPTPHDLAAWYCPQINPDPTGLTCQMALGPAPAHHEMQFHFELRYLIDNPNEFPIPTTEILAAINVFEGLGAMELGAVCAVLCDEGDFACTGEPGENSCKSDASDIETIEDVQNRLVELLILTVDAAINGELDNLAVRTIPAGAEHFEVRVRFSLGIDAMIGIMAELVDQLVEKFVANEPIAFEIPFSVRGTLWFDVPILGRVALGYGPLSDVWILTP